MRCRICGGAMERRITDLPFKLSDASIVIVKALPVLQCRQCGETELENSTMSQVDRLLTAVDRSAELEVIRYAA
ncbi:MAG: type II toxin-antitoxin system MqsA family antitoxin [Bryobacteraceae bacterium]